MDEASRQEEDELAIRQGGKVYPVGRVLRATYDAENHDSLGRDVTGLMLDLARVPYEPAVGDGGADAGVGERAHVEEHHCARDPAVGQRASPSLLGMVRSWWER